MKRISENRNEGPLCNSRVSTSFRGLSPREKIGSTSKQARDFEILLRDLEIDHPWSTLCLQEFTASNGEVVSETSEGHKVFVTPPCKEQLRLAIVASAEVLAFCEY